MSTKAAIIREPKQDGWEVVEVDLGDPRAGEVQIKLAASGLCHSDEHLLTGDLQFETYPIIGGHEGAGVVTKVGEGVMGLEEGDHVVLAFIPACGECAPCLKGYRSLCDRGAVLLGADAIGASGDRLSAEVLDLENALVELETLSPRQANVVECRFFAGLSVDETAQALGVSSPTVKREWRVARAWLAQALGGGPQPHTSA